VLRDPLARPSTQSKVSRNETPAPSGRSSDDKSGGILFSGANPCSATRMSCSLDAGRAQLQGKSKRTHGMTPAPSGGSSDDKSGGILFSGANPCSATRMSCSLDAGRAQLQGKSKRAHGKEVSSGESSDGQERRGFQFHIRACVVRSYISSNLGLCNVVAEKHSFTEDA